MRQYPTLQQLQQHCCCLYLLDRKKVVKRVQKTSNKAATGVPVASTKQVISLHSLQKIIVQHNVQTKRWPRGTKNNVNISTSICQIPAFRSRHTPASQLQAFLASHRMSSLCLIAININMFLRNAQLSILTTSC